MLLRGDYRPEFESFKSILLELARIRSADELLHRVVMRLAERPHVALARIWLAGKGDRCPTCRWNSQCANKTICLHLKASAGQSHSSMDDWSRCDGEFSRIPEGMCTVGQIAASGEGCVTRDVAREGFKFARPDWVRREGICGFNGHPIIYDKEVMGVVAVFTRIPTPEEAPTWLRILADYIAVSLINAHAIEEIEHLRAKLELENAYLREEVLEAKSYGEILGEGEVWRRLLKQIDKVARTDATVLIQGESGTGKELVAREIHRRSRRKDQPLIRVNCASIPRELYESEFFGHTKGAFTGAIKDRAGRFEAADGGTLFLDEVAEIPLELQSKLLRVLQDGQYERVGEEKTRTANVRLIAATNRNLQQEISAGRFREDLYYRLNVFPIRVAPLRERREDIRALALHFLGQAARRLHIPTPRLTAAHLRQLEGYEWPGNIRELQNVIERASILAQEEEDALHFDLPAWAQIPSPPQHTGGPHQVLSQAELLDQERKNTLAALTQTNWKIHGPGGAAQLLGVKPTTLIARLKRLGLKRPY